MNEPKTYLDDAEVVAELTRRLGCGGVLSIPYENDCVRGTRAAVYVDTVETGGRPVFRNVKYAPRLGLAGHVGYISPDRVLGVGHPLADDASEAFQSWRTSWTTTHCMASGGQRWGRCPRCEAESDGLTTTARPAARRWGE